MKKFYFNNEEGENLFNQNTKTEFANNFQNLSLPPVKQRHPKKE